MPQSVKLKKFDQEISAIRNVFNATDSPFRADLEKSCTPKQQEQMKALLQKKAEVWLANVTYSSPGYNEVSERDWEQLEGELGSIKRQELIQELKPQLYSVQNEMDWKIKNSTRMNYWHANEEYVDMNNSHDVNEQRLNDELEAIDLLASQYHKYENRINKEEFTQTIQMLKKRAQLWDKLRRDGPDFPAKEMKELAQLERSPFAEKSEMVGIVELGLVNASLGLIKEGADEIFPEFAQLREYLQKQKMAENGPKKSLNQWDNLGKTGRNTSDSIPTNREARETANKGRE